MNDHKKLLIENQWRVQRALNKFKKGIALSIELDLRLQALQKEVKAIKLEHRTAKFTDLVDADNPIANYLDDSLSEENLINLILQKEKLSDLEYGLVALKWQLIHKGVDYEMAYVKLKEKMPVTQEDYDAILKELQTLLQIPNPN